MDLRVNQPFYLATNTNGALVDSIQLMLYPEIILSDFIKAAELSRKFIRVSGFISG